MLYGRLVMRLKSNALSELDIRGSKQTSPTVEDKCCAIRTLVPFNLEAGVPIAIEIL